MPHLPKARLTAIGWVGASGPAGCPGLRAANYSKARSLGPEHLPAQPCCLPKGLSLGVGGGRVGKGKAGRKLSYTATVQGNGNLLVGKAFAATLDLQPGDEFEIKLGKKQIRLVPVGGSDEEE